MKILFKCPRCSSVVGRSQLWCEGCDFQLDIEGYDSWEEATKEKNDDECYWDDDF